MPTKPVLLILVAVALVGCSSAPAAPPSAATAAPVAPSSSTVASTAPSTRTSVAPSVAPSPSAAAEIDLMTALPKTAGGLPLDTAVIPAANIAKIDSFAGLRALLAQQKVAATDAKVVVGWGGQSQGEQIVTAIQIPGASPTVMKAFEHTLDPMAITMGLDGKAETVGGKAVLSFEGQPPTYVYINGDTAFVVRTDAATAKEVIAALP